MKLREIPYTASEAAKATGRSLENQRNDRRIRAAPKIKGHSRDWLPALVRKFVMQEFSDVPGPLKAAAFASDIAAQIAHRALKYPALYSPGALAAIGLNEGQFFVPRVHWPIIDCAPEDGGFGMGIAVWSDGQFWVGERPGEKPLDLVVSDPLAGRKAFVWGFEQAANRFARQLPRPMFYLESEC